MGISNVTLHIATKIYPSERRRQADWFYKLTRHTLVIAGGSRNDGEGQGCYYTLLFMRW